MLKKLRERGRRGAVEVMGMRMGTGTGLGMMRRRLVGTRTLWCVCVLCGGKCVALVDVDVYWDGICEGEDVEIRRWLLLCEYLIGDRRDSPE